MRKKDLIIIAALANLGVLAILFMLSSRVDEESASNHEEVSYIIQDMTQTPEQISDASLEEPTDADGMNLLLSKNTPKPSEEFVVEEEIPLLDQEHATSSEADTENDTNEEHTPKGSVIEITVKRGDALEKIARSHGTTVEAIKKANSLTSDKLKIGQVLRVTEGDTKEKPASGNKSETSAAAPQEKYYTIKNGDNPWKIAKKFNLKVDELLKMNDLDEDKARNLKVGDQIQVKK